jgi:hypothetical protein
MSSPPSRTTSPTSPSVTETQIITRYSTPATVIIVYEFKCVAVVMTYSCVIFICWLECVLHFMCVSESERVCYYGTTLKAPDVAQFSYRSAAKCEHTSNMCPVFDFAFPRFAYNRVQYLHFSTGTEEIPSVPGKLTKSNLDKANKPRY